jgi:hypothetical protein
MVGFNSLLAYRKTGHKEKIMTILDELLDKLTKREREAVIEICKLAGTYDADWKILEAAGKLLAEARMLIETLQYGTLGD